MRSEAATRAPHEGRDPHALPHAAWLLAAVLLVIPLSVLAAWMFLRLLIAVVFPR
ncbi:hypothetical protein PXJ20_27040 [Paraburkholderia sp. A1RI_3L]|uniref:hypothetical protein n=1 Tax=Paraburkholderia TaxID=1822464 RepID=UPI003B78CFBF